ncbi:MAG: hypothetical protein AB7N91_32830 [Candidatus Tectimicrobiota bacterium]
MRAEETRCPHQEAERTAEAVLVGHDGSPFLAALCAETAPSWLRELPAVDTLRHVWRQRVLPLDAGGAGWRDQAAVPPGAQHSHAPYDPEAHDAQKRVCPWLGGQRAPDGGL